MSNTLRQIRASRLVSILPWAILLASWTIFTSLIVSVFLDHHDERSHSRTGSAPRSPARRVRGFCEAGAERKRA